MSPEEITAMQAENAALKGQVTTLEATIVQKDALITQKTQDVVGARRKYKTLAELTDEEKTAMTESEIKAKEEQDILFEQQEATRIQQETDRAAQIAERKRAAAIKLVGNDETLIAKTIANFDQIKNADVAFTESEIGTFMGTAVNMLGDERPDPVRSAANTSPNGEFPATQNQSTGFAESEAGKQVGQSLGLQSAQEPPKAA